MKNYSWLNGYIDAFCRCWNTYLGDDIEMQADIHVNACESMIEIEFYPMDIENDLWNVKVKYNKNLPRQPAQIVSDDGIIIIKHKDKGFWIRGLAREDANATLNKRMMDTISYPKEI